MIIIIISHVPSNFIYATNILSLTPYDPALALESKIQSHQRIKNRSLLYLRSAQD